MKVRCVLQREHYKLDWHRFNLRQKMAGLLPLTAEEFERKTGAGEDTHTFKTEFNRKRSCYSDCKRLLCFTGDLSSISGSESDSDEEDSDSNVGVTSSNVTGTDNESSGDACLINGRFSIKVVFQNAAGEYLSVYRCALQGKVRQPQQVRQCVICISVKTNVIVVSVRWWAGCCIFHECHK